MREYFSDGLGFSETRYDVNTISISHCEGFRRLQNMKSTSYSVSLKPRPSEKYSRIFTVNVSFIKIQSVSVRNPDDANFMTYFAV